METFDMSHFATGGASFSVHFSLLHKSRILLDLRKTDLMQSIAGEGAITPGQLSRVASVGLGPQRDLETTPPVPRGGGEGGGELSRF